MDTIECKGAAAGQGDEMKPPTQKCLNEIKLSEHKFLRSQEFNTKNLKGLIQRLSSSPTTSYTSFLRQIFKVNLFIFTKKMKIIKQSYKQTIRLFLLPSSNSRNF